MFEEKLLLIMKTLSNTQITQTQFVEHSYGI